METSQLTSAKINLLQARNELLTYYYGTLDERIDYVISQIEKCLEILDNLNSKRMRV